MKKNEQSKINLKAESKSDRQGKPLSEVWGVACLFCATLLLISLGSYSPDDPSINHSIVGPGFVEIQNWAGVFGSYLSALLNDLLGSGAYAFIIFFVTAGIRICRRKEQWSLARWCCFAPLALCISVISSACDVSFGGLHFGGIIGDIALQLTVGIFGKVGSILIWICIVMMVVQAIIGFSWIRLWRNLFYTARVTFLKWMEDREYRRRKLKDNPTLTSPLEALPSSEYPNGFIDAPATQSHQAITESRYLNASPSHATQGANAPFKDVSLAHPQSAIEYNQTAQGSLVYRPIAPTEGYQEASTYVGKPSFQDVTQPSFQDEANYGAVVKHEHTAPTLAQVSPNISPISGQAHQNVLKEINYPSFDDAFHAGVKPQDKSIPPLNVIQIHNGSTQMEEPAGGFLGQSEGVDLVFGSTPFDKAGSGAPLMPLQDFFSEAQQLADTKKSQGLAQRFKNLIGLGKKPKRKDPFDTLTNPFEDYSAKDISSSVGGLNLPSQADTIVNNQASAYNMPNSTQAPASSLQPSGQISPENLGFNMGQAPTITQHLEQVQSDQPMGQVWPQHQANYQVSQGLSVAERAQYQQNIEPSAGFQSAGAYSQEQYFKEELRQGSNHQGSNQQGASQQAADGALQPLVETQKKALHGSVNHTSIEGTSGINSDSRVLHNASPQEFNYATESEEPTYGSLMYAELIPMESDIQEAYNRNRPNDVRKDVVSTTISEAVPAPQMARAEEAKVLQPVSQPAYRVDPAAHPTAQEYRSPEILSSSEAMRGAQFAQASIERAQQPFSHSQNTQSQPTTHLVPPALVEEPVTSSFALLVKPVEQLDSSTVGSTSYEPKVPVAKRVPLKLPVLDLLTPAETSNTGMSDEELDEKGTALMTCLKDFSIQAELVRITPGPVVTQFEVRPAPGVKTSRISNLSDDLALSLKAMSVRIQAPIPGSDTVGIEIPNLRREIVGLKELLGSSVFSDADSLLSMGIGKDISGVPYVSDLAKMPHMLVAGATGTGKSVFLNSVLISLLYKARPSEVKLLLIDPKRIEMAVYADLPHLVHPIVTDMSMAKNALDWAVAEMDNRYTDIARLGVRNMLAFNEKLASYGDILPPEICDLKPLPYLVIIIDELADLMLTAGKDVETSIVRLAQLARAAGIHIIIATQRPSVDVVTGLIKANFPCRISFQVTSKHDSRTILDAVGAEHLLGRGDMLFKPAGGRFKRLHGAFVPDDDVGLVCDYWRAQQAPDYQVDFAEWGNSAADDAVSSSSSDKNVNNSEEQVYIEAVDFVRQQGKASISLIQRRFRIGFNRAARYIDQMEQDGIIGPADGSKPRVVR